MLYLYLDRLTLASSVPSSGQNVEFSEIPQLEKKHILTIG